MVNVKNLIHRDLEHVWHPCSQMKDFKQCAPLVVERARGSIMHTTQGPIIDAISSWWCKSLGHNHPAITAAISEQLTRFEHTIGANTTYPELVALAEKLAEITGLQHAFFASDGSCAVEIAMKLTLQANQIKGQTARNQFIALQNSYHGETFATLAVSDLGLYKEPFKNYCQTSHFLQSIPYVTGPHDPLWHDAQEAWKSIEQQLAPLSTTTSAIIVEPIVQGAAGMYCYSPDFLRRLAKWARNHDVYLIADEIMTGFGRTGKWLACEHANIKADIVCASKGLTSGTLPLSCALISHDIFNLFYDDYETGRAFLHSHTFSGNALAVRAALATIQVFEKEAINEQATTLGEHMLKAFQDVATQSGKITNIRAVGALVAGDLVGPPNQRIGFALYQEALKLGALLRPLGNTLYWTPPLTTNSEIIGQLAEITLQSIKNTYKKMG